jgi:hypothetical protein
MAMAPKCTASPATATPHTSVKPSSARVPIRHSSAECSALPTSSYATDHSGPSSQ